MSEDRTNEAQATAPAVEEEANTTPPNPPAPVDGKSDWKMPDPVFRKTSGYLPEGFEKRYPQAEIKGVDDTVSTDSMPRPDLTVDVGPQPDIGDAAESASSPDTAASATAPKRGSGLRIALWIIGLLAAIGLIAVFIAVVYVLFLSPSANGTF